MNEQKMIPCDHVIAQLWEYLDGELDELRSQEVRQHLERCARCFPEHDFRGAYLKLMRRCSTQQVPVELRRRIFETVLEEEHEAATAARPASGTGILERARFTLRRLLCGD
ncbi:MAG: zf-HC2 domain-containing protein [Gemmatimonadetes bacterium]|nr:zf-HC2 domain-containing protein [Gemmatimonadota bacterium]